MRSAVEQDHIPSRALFADRAWPEGYEFPACYKCNHATQGDEEVVAFLARAYPDPQTPGQAAELDRIARSLGQYRPELLEEMRHSAREIRNELARRKIRLPPGMSTRDVPLLRTSGELVNAAVRNFGLKLFLALYYKETGLILPQSGGIGLRWYSNLQINEGVIPKQLGNVLPGFPKLTRNGGDLSSQFFYRFGIVDTKKVAAFLAFFRESFGILGFLNWDAGRLTPPVPAAEILHPYCWPADRVNAM